MNVINFFRKKSVQNEKYVPFFELLPCPYNRQTEPEKIRAIKDAISATGNIKPFVVCEVLTDSGKKLMITDGHHRALAITELFSEGKFQDTLKVPVVISDKKGVESADGESSKKVLHNATEWPKDYTCSFMEAGVVSYEDVNSGIALVRKETIEKMLPSFIGKPVVSGIDKKSGGHVKVTPHNFKEFAVGYVTDVFFNQTDGWFYAKFILTDDEAKKLVKEGYSVSCSFDVKEVGPGGEWHAVKFDQEILNGEFVHLAIVDNPRYEDCKILVNSKGAKKMFGLFTKKKSKENEKVEEKEKMNMSEVFVDVDGQKVSCEELLKYASKPEDKEVYEAMPLESEIEDETGNKHKVAELVEKFKASKKNEKPAEEEKPKDEKNNSKEGEEEEKPKEEEKPADEKPKEEEKPADEKPKEEEKPSEESKENSKKSGIQFFRKIQNAKDNAVHGEGNEKPAGVMHETVNEKVARGQEKYGSKK